jgi:hypothetical protein
LLIIALVGIILVVAVMLARVEAQRCREGLHARGGINVHRCVARLSWPSFFAASVLRAALQSNSSALYFVAALLAALGAIGRLARVQDFGETHELLKRDKRWWRAFWFVMAGGFLVSFWLPALLGIEAALPFWFVFRVAIGFVGGQVLWWFVTAAAALVYSTRPCAVLYCVWKAEFAWPLKAIRWLRSRGSRHRREARL